ncbi:hypothetical protein TWF694_004577 [Orbilia ellipsospora]|uniref:Nucleoside phosphorylase domain-containing protein n=1 Tax=Orbilia ellipsospora TaxID=2528407 RepID=A0AAV9WVK6_9PEZI
MLESNKNASGKESVSSGDQRRKENDSVRQIIFTHSDYTVGWICALSKEQTAATAMLDHRHNALSKPPNDPNAYTVGSIGKHNIVIACLPEGEVGNNSAANVVAWVASTFPSIKFGLMVGIGGGIPPKVRLGDVVVSTPVGKYSGVIQWDFGKTGDGGKFERVGSLNNPPTSLRTAITKLKTAHELEGSKIPIYLDELKQKYPKLAPRYTWSESLKDPLDTPENSSGSLSIWKNIFFIFWNAALFILGHHLNLWAGLTLLWATNTTKTASSGARTKPREPHIHYGLIASGNQVIKDATFRDKLDEDLGGRVLCVEMEAAGLMNNFQCIVIRGICDYADEHKNKDWQEYVAAIAAAFAKELLEYVQSSDVDGERPVKDILGPILTTVFSIDKTIEIVKSKLNTAEDLKILNWLTPVNQGSQHSDYLRRREVGTGQWLLNSAEFKSWVSTDRQTLFCTGIPGAGKTILTAILVDDLENRFQDDPMIGIGYIYCNFQQQDEHQAENLLTSLLKQLIQGQSSLPGVVETLYNRHKKGTRPQLNEIMETLKSVVNLYSRVFIVVDALDECQPSHNCRWRFLSEIFSLQAKYNVNIFATSRHVPEIQEKFNGSTLLEVRASTDDVRRYLDGRMHELATCVRSNPELQEEIKTKIVKAVDGMFLLAQLHFSSLLKERSRKAIRKVLDKLPSGSEAYSETYSAAMARIEGQLEAKDLAKRVLLWIACAKRRLTTTELQHALAVEVGEKELDEENIINIQDLVSICAGLVIVDKESNIIRLIHYTTQEYFEHTQKHWFPHAETEITKVCVTYLSFQDFGTHVCSSTEFEKRLGSHILYDYATQNWGYHAYAASTEANLLILSFLENKANISGCGYAMASRSISSYGPKNMTAGHLTAYFGLEEITASLLKKGYYLDVKDSFKRTPLSWAAERGHKGVVILLLSQDGVDIESKDFRGRTPLALAVASGHEAVARLLLDKGAYQDCKSRANWTPLFEAASNGYESLTKLLLERGADPNFSTPSFPYGLTNPLILAARSGHEAIVKLLLDNGANPEFKGSRAPLSFAAEKGYDGIVKMILEKGGIDVDSKDSRSTQTQTPLWYAAKEGHDMVVRLLLATNKVDPDFKDAAFNRTPLSYAAGNGHSKIVKQLLENGGVDVNSKDRDNKTPLWYAAKNGHEIVVKLLLAMEKVDPEPKDSIDERTPLSYAAENGHEDVVRLLFATGRVELDSKGSTWEWTPLFYAAKKGHDAVVKLLLATGKVDPNFENESGKTPLMCAIENSNRVVVKLLLATGRIDLNCGDELGNTPLSYAAREGSKAITKLLLATGKIDINRKNKNGYTSLQHAVWYGRERVVRLLLESGAEPDPKDYMGRTPLLHVVKSYSRSKMHAKIFELLLATEGVDPDTKDNTGRTPLSYAAEAGHEVAVKTLVETARVDLDSRDNSGRTPLSYAAKGYHTGVIEILLTPTKVDADAKDDAGRHCCML